MVGVGLGVTVAARRVGVGEFWLVGVAEADATETGVGETKMILIAPSSGTGDRVFPRVSNTTKIMPTRARKPTMIVTAAIVFLRSSMPSSVTLENNRIKFQ